MALFTLWDYLVVASVLIISAGFGLYYGLGSDVRTKSGFLLADSKMSSWPVAFSLMATCSSAILLLGYTQEGYQFGIGLAWESIPILIATPLMAYLLLPVFYKMRVTSVYEYFEKRFGYATRLLVSVTFFLQTLLLLGLNLYAPATTLVTVTGISKTTAIIAIGLVVTFYSTVGGMKAILFTDVFQSFLMFAGMLSIIIGSILKEHWLGEIWKTARTNDRMYWPSFAVDPTLRQTFWSITCGGVVVYLSLCVSQMQVQRLMAVKSLALAQRAMMWSMPLIIMVIVSSIFIGLVIFNFYKDCDPVLEGRIGDHVQLLPLFVTDTMKDYPGLPGLFVSGLFCACLSTLSSILSGLSANVVEDYIEIFYAKVIKKPLETTSSFLAKMIVCIFGIVCLMSALFHSDTSKGIMEITKVVVGSTGGPIFGLFFLGLFTIKSNQCGSLIGLVVGLVGSGLISLGQSRIAPVTLPLTDVGCELYNTTRATEVSPLKEKEVEVFYLFKISYLWLPLLGFLLTTIVGYLCSVLLEKFNLANNDKIYLDAARSRINVNVFSPPLSAYLKRKASARIAEVKECELTLRNSEF